jgi:hypothetical protein
VLLNCLQELKSKILRSIVLISLKDSKKVTEGSRLSALKLGNRLKLYNLIL